MLLFRLKLEFRELRFILLTWILSLLVLTHVVNLSTQTAYLNYQRSSHFNEALSIITPFLLIGSALALVFFLFRPDHFKSPSAFWNTRPIRGKTIFLAKWIFLQITITLPIAIFGVVYCLLLGRSVEAWSIGLEYGIEAMLLTTAISYSTIATPVRQLTAWLFVGGLAITAIALNFISSPHSFDGSLISPEQRSLNFIGVTIILLIIFAVFFFRQITSRHRSIPLLVFPLLGCGTILAAFISPIPTGTTTEIAEEVTISPSGKPQWRGGYEGDQNFLGLHQHFDNSIFAPFLPKGSYIANTELSLSQPDSAFPGHIEINLSTNQLNLKFFNQEPIDTGSSGSGSFENEALVQALPLSVPITITGRLLIKTPQLDPVVKLSPVSMIDWTDAPSFKYSISRQRDEIVVATRSFHPFSLWQENSRQRPLDFSFLLDGKGTWTEAGSSGNRGGTFARFEQEFRLWDADNPSIEEALKSSTLTISRNVGTDLQIVNITIHTTIPDPNQIIKLIEKR